VFKGINSVGLKRRGFNLQDRSMIKKIYKIYFLSGSNRKDSIKKVLKEIPSSDIKSQIVNFIESSNRGII
jgi:UDP-N-acetylglucosamine acyltransferase